MLLGLLAVIALLLLSIFLYFQFSDCGIAPWGCGDYTPEKEWKTQRIAVGSGPEDMAIDTSNGVTRIIVSCAERRADKQKIGKFYQLNPKDNSVASLEMIPANLTIQPHGIDVVTIDTVPFLYAISHEEENNKKRHKIYRFQIKQNRLLLDEDFTLEHPLMTGPNDLDVLEDGSIYITNPMPSDENIESTKAILGIKTGTVLHYDGKGNWKTVLKDMCYPNGIFANPTEGYLMVANGGCQAVERFPIKNGQVIANEKLSTKKYNVDIPIGDNLLMDNRGNVWIAAHPCPLKFLSHATDSQEPSPAQVFKINPETLKSELVFQTNGELISAASTALKIDDKLYISQVFDPFVLVVDGVN